VDVEQILEISNVRPSIKTKRKKIMAYKKRTRRNVSEIIPEDQEMMAEVKDFAYEEAGSNDGFLKFIIMALIIVILIVGGWYLIDKYTTLNLPGMGSSQEVSADGWHAIFLSNNQVYFGQIEKITSEDLVLTDIYYLQVVNSPLQMSQDGATEQQQPTQQELTLAKLGSELHGPTDRMVINRDHILLTEELKDTSKVVTAISAYIEEQKKK